MTNTFDYTKGPIRGLEFDSSICPLTDGLCEMGCPELACLANEEHIERGSE